MSNIFIAWNKILKIYCNCFKYFTNPEREIAREEPFVELSNSRGRRRRAVQWIFGKSKDSLSLSAVSRRLGTQIWLAHEY